jgi:cell division transport system permease protein
MMNGLSQHLYVLRASLGRLFGHPVATLLNVLVIGVALSLPAGLYVLIQNVQGMADQVAGTPQISVFLSMNASDDDIARIGKQLRLDPSIDHIECRARKRWSSSSAARGWRT